MQTASVKKYSIVFSGQLSRHRPSTNTLFSSLKQLEHWSKLWHVEHSSLQATHLLSFKNVPSGHMDTHWFVASESSGVAEGY